LGHLWGFSAAHLNIHAGFQAKVIEKPHKYYGKVAKTLKKDFFLNLLLA